MKGTQKNNLVSIGQVADLTGISVFTLRMWERRYGAPFSKKLQSGHRRYDEEEISRLRLVKELIELGEKPSKIAALDKYDLLSRLNTIKKNRATSVDISHIPEAWLSFIKNWDDNSFEESLEVNWMQLSFLDFIDLRVIPFLKKMGESWERGELSISQEHLASHVLHGFLMSKWRTDSLSSSDKTILLAAMPGESHSFALQLCALCAVRAGFKVLFVGSETPLASILEACVASECSCVAITMSQFGALEEKRKQLVELRRMIPDKIPMIVGGDGAPEGVNGVVHLHSFADFFEYLKTF